MWLDFKIMLLTIPALIKKEYAFADENIEIDEIVRVEKECDKERKNIDEIF